MISIATILNSIYTKLVNITALMYDFYNINETIILNGTNTVTLSANTYHSVSIIVLTGSVDITESNVTFTALLNYTIDMEASTRLTNSITLLGKTSDTKVIIKTIK